MRMHHYFSSFTGISLQKFNFQKRTTNEIRWKFYHISQDSRRLPFPTRSLPLPKRNLSLPIRKICHIPQERVPLELSTKETNHTKDHDFQNPHFGIKVLHFGIKVVYFGIKVVQFAIKVVQFGVKVVPHNHIHYHKMS